MKNGSVMKLLNASKQFAKNHSSEIMTALGIGSMVVAVGSAITSTPKAIANAEQAEKEKGEPLTKVEVVKATWKCYIPTAVSFAVGTGCLIKANSINTGRVAMWAGACKLSETKLSDLQDAITETVGEEKAQEIKEKASEKHVERVKSPQPNTYILGNGLVWCKDPLSNQEFMCDRETIRAAENRAMWRINHFDYVSLNDFYSEIDAPGLERTDIGDMVGWNHDNPIDISFSGDINAKGIPLLTIDYLVSPKQDFDKL